MDLQLIMELTGALGIGVLAALGGPALARRAQALKPKPHPFGAWDVAHAEEEDDAGNTHAVIVATSKHEVRRFSPRTTDTELAAQLNVPHPEPSPTEGAA